MKKPEEKSEGKKTPKRFYIEIPKGYFSASEAEQDDFLEVLIARVRAKLRNPTMSRVRRRNERNGWIQRNHARSNYPASR